MADGGPSAYFARNLAVVIGIDRYGHGVPALRNAVSDARALAAALRRDHGFETLCLFDEDAGLERLLALLRDQLPAMLGRGDRLLFYFAGHGIAREGAAGAAGYLLPACARRAERDGLPMQLLHDALIRLPVRHALVILDCCFAGAFRWSSLRDAESGTGKLHRERYQRYLESAAWQVLTSVSSDQLAFDELADGRGIASDGHSPFASAVLAGLAGSADYTEDGVITADELALYVRTRVARTVEAVGRRQLPQLFPLAPHEAGQFLFHAPNRTVALEPAPALDENASPYRGLESFRTADQKLFFGRDALIAHLKDTVVACRLTVVVGPSGAGKSSLVQAGLLPALAEAGWTVLSPERPGRQPLRTLEAWTCALGASAISSGPVASWLAAAAARQGTASGRWLVVIDQLEELFTHRTPAAERDAFLGALAAALHETSELHMVVTVRSDAEPQFADTALAPWFTSGGRVVVTRMTTDELRQVIVRPAGDASLHFEPPDLVDRLLHDVGLVTAPLPLLSFALHELYRACARRWRAGTMDRALRGADYGEMGGVARALTQRATGLHDQLVREDVAYANTMRNLFVRMVAMVGGEIARRRVPRSELSGSPEEEQRTGHVLQRFHEARLVSLDGEYAEPTHDEVVHGWDKVGRWLDELDQPAGTRALLSALGGAARAWRDSDCRDEYLWMDPRAEILAAPDHPLASVFNRDEAAFVVRGARRRRARRMRVRLIAAAVFAAISIFALVAAWQRARAEDNADEAQRQRVVAEQRLAASYLERGHRLLLDDHPMQALPYFVAARAAGTDGPVLRMLFGRVSRSLPLATIVVHDSAVTAALGPDGSRVVVVSGRTARVWDATSGQPVTPSLVHDDDVQSAAFSPDGGRVVTASADGAARMWSADGGARLGPALAHRGAVTAARFSPDGRRVITASRDGTAQIWDAATGAPVAPAIDLRAPVDDAEFSPDGRRVIVIGHDGDVQIWDVVTQRALARLQHDGIVTHTAFSPDGAHVIIGSLDGMVRIWDTATGAVVTPSLVHRHPITAAMFSPDGRRALTASDDVAQVWDASTGAGRSPSLRPPAPIAAAALTPDGAYVIAASYDHVVRVFDASTGASAATPLEHPDAVTSVAVSADGARVVTASHDGIVRIWPAPRDAPSVLPASEGEPVATVLSADGAYALTSDGSEARIWRTEGWRRVGSGIARGERVVGGAFSTDGARVVTVSEDRGAQRWRAQLWNAATGGSIGAPLDESQEIALVAFSPDGARLVAAGGTLAYVLEAATGERRAPPLMHANSVTAAAFRADGARVVTGSKDGAASVWDAATGARVIGPVVHPGPVTAVAISPGGDRAVSASEEYAQIWNAVTGVRVAQRLMHRGIVNVVAFSPDGNRVVTASEDQTGRVWDAATGVPVTTPLEHEGAVVSAAFSPDGTRVLTASSDGTVRVWDAGSGRPLAAVPKHPGPLIGAVFGRGATQVATITLDKTPRVWPLPTDSGTSEEWRARAACAPFVLAGGVPIANPAPPSACAAAIEPGARTP